MLQWFRVERESTRATVSSPSGMMQATAAGNETPWLRHALKTAI
jgi:hypothetical protein